MKHPTQVRYTPDSPIKRAILTIYGTSQSETLTRTKRHGTCLKGSLPAESVVKTPTYQGYDTGKGRHCYEMAVFLGPDAATAQAVIERCITRLCES